MHIVQRNFIDLNPIIPLFKNDPDIMELYVLGSAATGSMRPDSDIDLAILNKAAIIERAIVESRWHSLVVFCQELGLVIVP